MLEEGSNLWGYYGLSPLSLERVSKLKKEKPRIDPYLCQSYEQLTYPLKVSGSSVITIEFCGLMSYLCPVVHESKLPFV